MRFRLRWGAAVVVAALAVALAAACGLAGRASGRAEAAPAVGGAGDAGHADGPSAHAARTVRVRPGDTLWDLARQYLPDTDPRRAVNVLMRLNGLESPLLRPGTLLRLPPPSRR